MNVFMEESVNAMDETVVVAYQAQTRLMSVPLLRWLRQGPAAGSCCECDGVVARACRGFECAAE